MTKDSLRKAIEQCVNCGKCRVKCPTLDANEEGTPYWEIFGPRGRMLLSKGILNDEVKITERLHDGLFTCFFCNQCVEDCPSHIPITEVLVETRKHLVEKGDAPTKVLESHDTINDSKNLFGMDQEDRVDLWSMDVEELLEGRVNVLADILYFVGCQAAFRGALAKIAVRMVQIMDKLQLNFTILGEDELCCGDPMQLTGGKDDDLLALARENTSRIDALGVKNVLFTCPGCYRMFTKVYPGLLGREPRFKSMMISEFLLQLIEDGKIQFNECPEIGRVTYHDPCDLGRHMDIYEPPRKILESIPNIDFVEMKNNREECACCGMGGGAAIHDMSFSKYQAKKKARDIDEIDAEVVVTHCPACFQGISESTNNLKKNGKEVIVMDLVELVAIALGIEK